MQIATVKAFAKINLGLKVLGLRNDGFHELRTIYQSISLFDTIEVAVSTIANAPQVVLSVSGIHVPAGGENLAARAASAVCAAAGVKQQVHIRLKKRIPLGAGLGGGSSDAAAVIRALQILAKKPLPAEALFQVAGSLGSDVPFFLFGGRAIGVGRGEEVYPLQDGAAWNCVVALPEEGMSTADAYRRLGAKPWPPASKNGQSKHLGAALPQPTMGVYSAALLAEADNSAMEKLGAPENDFEPLLFGRFPQLAETKRTLLRCGAIHASLTGSGSAVYGLFRTVAQASAAHRKLIACGMRVYSTRTVGRRQYARGLRLG
jgi:4-diphosphocytidyl-2-C-methyl-D-erythritol kinase